MLESSSFCVAIFLGARTYSRTFAWIASRLCGFLGLFGTFYHVHKTTSVCSQSYCDLWLLANRAINAPPSAVFCLRQPSDLFLANRRINLDKFTITVYTIGE